MDNQRLALGTVQFGLPYGVANQSGQVNRDEATSILEHAWSNGLDTLDTAIVYGESEQRLGEIGVMPWQVVSKLPAMSESGTDVIDWVLESVHGSLERLGIPKLYGLLLHNSQQLLGTKGKELFGALVELKKRGVVEKTGVSIYSPAELDALWPDYQLDIVQAPFNIIDRRLLSTGWLSKLHKAGTEVHVRSVFLQGLLLMEQAKRPAYFNKWQPYWDQWHHWLDTKSLLPLNACLGFALSQPEIDRVVIGVDTLDQLKEIIACVKNPIEIPPKTLMSEDLDLINPSHWNVS